MKERSFFAWNFGGVMPGKGTSLKGFKQGRLTGGYSGGRFFVWSGAKSASVAH